MLRCAERFCEPARVTVEACGHLDVLDVEIDLRALEHETEPGAKCNRALAQGARPRGVAAIAAAA